MFVYGDILTSFSVRQSRRGSLLLFALFSFGQQRYVFNIKGDDFRLVAVIKFTIRFVYIRFIGTHKEYDRIDCRNI